MSGLSLPVRAALVARLARRELRVGVRGFGVFLGCLALGVFAVSGVGSFAAAARSGLVADARSLLGGDLEVRLVHRPIPAEALGFLAARGAVSAVTELRAMAAAPGGDPARRTLVELKAVDGGYPLYGAARLEPAGSLAAALAQVDGVWGAVVDPALLARLGLAVGDALEVGEARLAVRAVLAQEPDLAVQGFSLGPRVMLGEGALAATGLVQPGSLVQYAYRVRLADLADEAEVAALKIALDEGFPEAGWRLRSFEGAAPRVQFFLDRMAANLTLVGLCTLLIGGLGVAGAVRGYLAGRLFHLAAMKCVGASGRLLFAAYLVQLLLMGALGAAVGIALGGAVPYLVAGLWGEALPFPLRPGVSPGPLGLAAAAGLLVALVFSLRPLGAAIRVSPAVLLRGSTGLPRVPLGAPLAVATVGAGGLLVGLAVLASGDRRLALWFSLGAAVAFVLFRALAGAVPWVTRRLPRFGPPPVRLGLANIGRPDAPARSAIFSLGLGMTALVAVGLVEANLNDLVGESLPEQAPAFFFIDLQPDQLAGFRERVEAVPGFRRLEAVPTLRGRITAIGGRPVDEVKIDPEVSWAVRGDRFLTYAAAPPRGAEIVAGQWWPEAYAGPPAVSLTEDVAQGFGIGVGDTLGVNVLGRTFTVEVRNLRRVDWSTLELNFVLIFAPGALEGAPHTHMAAVHVDPAAEEAVFRAVAQGFPNVSAIELRRVLANVAGVLERIGAVFRAMAGLAVLTGFLVLAGAVSADQHRRIYDAVVFKVCGATRGDILATFLVEYAVLGGAAGLLAVLVGSGAAWGILRFVMDSPFRLHPGVAAATVGVGLALTLLLGLMGTARALARPAAPLLRNE